MSHHPPSTSGENPIRGLLGYFDNGFPPVLNTLHNRSFWWGAAIGVGAILLLKARATAKADAKPASIAD